MMQIQDLFQTLGIQPQLRTDVDAAELIRYTYRNSYCVNEAGKLTALNLCGLDLAFTHEQAKAFLEFDWGELISLNLSENRFASLRLPAMPKLRFLNVSEAKNLFDLSFSAALPALEELDVNECELSKQLVLANGFAALKYLDVSRNKELRELVLQGSFPSLSYLDASNNNLKTLQFSEPLAALQHLYLGENVIENWDWIKPFPQLETLHTNQNRLRKLPATDVEALENIFPRLLNLNVDKNDFPDTIKTFSEGKRCDLQKLGDYLLDFAKGSTLDNECKVLLIGNGNVGKSCLVNRIVHDNFNPDWDSTHAIVIMEPFEDERVNPWKLNFWDFGGQDIYHATHRLFMQSNAVYLLLWDKETEGKSFTERTEAGKLRKYRNFKLPYWLAYAKSLGKGSPILIVQTKCYIPEDEEVLPEIHRAYPKIKFHHVDSGKKDWDENGVDDLLRNIKRAVGRVKPKAEIPSNWVAVREAIRSLQQKDQKLPEKEREHQKMTKEAFIELARPFEVKDPIMVLQWLSETGVLFYDFNQERLFKGQIILDQEWAIKAIYTLFDREDFYYGSFQNQQGRFSGKDLVKVWKAHSQEAWELFVSFMLSCELCFEVEKEEKDRWTRKFEEREFIAPQMLNEEVPNSVEDFWEGRSSLYFRYSQDFLHYGVMQRFIIRTQQLAEVRDIWRYGIVLRKDNERALVNFEQIEEGEAVRMELRIRVTPAGKFLLDAIRNLIEELQNSPGTESASVDGENFVSLQDLLAHDSQEKRIKCENGKYADFEAFRPFLQKDSNAKIDSPDPHKITSPMSKTQQVSARKHIKSLIAKNEFHQALSLITEVDSSMENDVIHQSSRLYGLENEEAKGLINSENAKLTRNQIRHALTQLADKVPEGAVIDIEMAPQQVTKVPASITESIKSDRPKVYFSYAWGDNKEEGESRQEIVDRMYEALEKDGFELGRDKMSVEYAGLISEFMQELAEGDLVVVFVSEKYLKSPYCMWELCEIYRTSMQDKKRFSTRILPIRVESLTLDGPRSLRPYMTFWRDFFEEWSETIRDFPQQVGPPQYDRFNKAKVIKDQFATVVDHFNDMNSSTNTLLSENDFERVKSMILKRLGR